MTRFTTSYEAPGMHGANRERIEHSLHYVCAKAADECDLPGHTILIHCYPGEWTCYRDQEGDLRIHALVKNVA